MKHPKHASMICIVHTNNHWTIMNMIGRWFPPSHDPDQAEMHHVLMLCLHKPWQELSLLKDEDESWKEAYDSFFQAAGASKQGIMANAQFYHECREVADHVVDVKTACSKNKHLLHNYHS